MLFSLAGSHKLGIALVGAAFCTFSLVCAMVIPRFRPFFPGKGLPLFMAVSGLFTAAMLTTVILLAGEPKEKAAEASPGTSETQPAETGAKPPGGAPTGDPVAGKKVFLTAGCTSCHTLSAAGSTGTVGPNLDQAKPPASLVVDRVTNGKGVMPSFRSSLSAKQIQDVAAFVSSATGGG